MLYEAILVLLTNKSFKNLKWRDYLCGLMIIYVDWWLFGVIKTNFIGNDVPKENMHCTCIACSITIDSVMRVKKNIFPPVYLEECKYKIKKIQVSRFINTELDSDAELDD